MLGDDDRARLRRALYPPARHEDDSLGVAIVGGVVGGCVAAGLTGALDSFGWAIPIGVVIYFADATYWRSKRAPRMAWINGLSDTELVREARRDGLDWVLEDAERARARREWTATHPEVVESPQRPVTPGRYVSPGRANSYDDRLPARRARTEPPMRIEE